MAMDVSVLISQGGSNIIIMYWFTRHILLQHVATLSPKFYYNLSALKIRL